MSADETHCLYITDSRLFFVDTVVEFSYGAKRVIEGLASEVSMLRQFDVHRLGSESKSNTRTSYDRALVG